MRILLLLDVFLIFTSFSLNTVANSFENTPLPAREAFKFSHQTTSEKITLKWDIAPNCYLYKDRIKLTSLNPTITVDELNLPKGEIKNDPNFGTVEVFHDSLIATASLHGSGNGDIEVSFQGCDEKTGICYQPVKELISVTLSKDSASDQTNLFAKKIAVSDSLLTTILLFLLAGLLLGVTPCVYPMVPVLASMLTAKLANRSSRVLTVIFYVLGVAVMFSLLGVLSALLGKSLTNYFQQWQFLLFGAIFVGFFALAMFNLIEIKLPQNSKINSLLQTSFNSAYQRILFSFVIGGLSALILSPCITPPMLSAILYIAEKGDVSYGAISLFVLAIGMSIPLILFSFGFGFLLPKSGAWLDEIRIAIGVLLLGLSVSLLGRFSPSWLSLILYGVVAIGYAMHLLIRYSNHQQHSIALGVRVIATIVVIGVTVLSINQFQTPSNTSSHLTNATSTSFYNSLPQATTIEELQQLVNQKKDTSRGILVFVHAQWCASCKELERHVYSDEAVKNSFASFATIGLDVTNYHETTQQYLISQGIVGPPVVLFLSNQSITASSQLPSLKQSPSLVGSFSKQALFQFLSTLP
ncbi:MAG: protein-disulfide reductase DsbD [Methylacidiphilales bacterium]|nr:protein-disulfide reductase DsbD [Candidatus Methylacidiphilales bacterium]